MTSSKVPTRYLALLRGINVGGKNMLPMKALTDIFRQAGCSDISTYIQSGNVVFTAPSSTKTTLSEQISAQIEAEFGYKIPVILRTLDELSVAISGNPFLSTAADEKALHIYFLQALPAAEDVALLNPNRSPPDAFAVSGQEIYLNLPNGMGHTKLTNAYFDSRLRTVSTARNWNTVLKLAEMMKA